MLTRCIVRNFHRVEAACACRCWDPAEILANFAADVAVVGSEMESVSRRVLIVWKTLPSTLRGTLAGHQLSDGSDNACKLIPEPS